MRIEKIQAREILSSGGRKTVEVFLKTNRGFFTASVPSGVSKGEKEAVETGVSRAVKNIETIIAKKTENKNFLSQKKLDDFLIRLDRTKNKSALGANALLAVSIACARAFAFENNVSLWEYIAEIAKTKPNLPKPCLLLIEGGKHGSGKLAFQEFLFVPEGESFRERLRAGREAYNNVREILLQTGREDGLRLGIEGAFTPEISEEEALLLIEKATSKKGKIGIDVAASSFFKEGRYNFQGKQLTGEALGEVFLKFIRKHSIMFIEDPFAENDFASWRLFELGQGQTPSALGGRGLPLSQLLVVGDDLICTNTARIKMAQKQKLCNGVIIKPNQVGTVTETVETFKLAKKFNWKTIVSHRGRETADSFISDLSAGLGADFIKAGGLAQKERLAKYNRLLEIENELC